MLMEDFFLFHEAQEIREICSLGSDEGPSLTESLLCIVFEEANACLSSGSITVRPKGGWF
jgi:hypothetical protein